MSDITQLTTQSELRLPFHGVLRAIGSALSVAWLVARDCRNAMLGTGVSVGAAFEMLYVEPYQPKRRDDEVNPENY